MYYEPDLSGQSDAYHIDSDPFAVFTDQQKIEFDGPVFADSIIVLKLETINQTLIKGVDWEYTEDDYDLTHMSKMKNYDPDFDAILVKSIRIIKPWSAYYRVSLSYQRLYPVNIKRALLNNNVIEFTPDLAGSMLENLEYLNMVIKPVADTHSLNENGPRLFPEDPHKESPTTNYVSEEVHEVNVLEGRNIIRPTGGTFFRDSVSVKLKDHPDDLVYGTDYVIFGSNLEKTRQTSNQSGVFEFILIRRQYVGEVEISYHAFGGEATLYDVTAINKTMNNIIAYLNDSAFLTTGALGTAPLIRDMADKMNALEEKMRKLIQDASYGDVSSGGAFLMKVSSADDQLHWFPIATLYKVDGSDEIVVADRMHFRVRTLRSKFMFDAMVSVNLDNPNDKFKVDILSENYEKGFVPFEDYSQIQNIIRPQLRILYNNDEIKNSGIVLQMGLEFKGFIEETIAVEDCSGKESCWKLFNPPATAMEPQDGPVQLPNADAIYDELNPSSTAISTLVPFKDGYITWAGSLALNRPEGGVKSQELGHILPNNIDLKRVTRARVEMQEQDGILFAKDIIFVPGSEDMTGQADFVYNGNVCHVSLRIWRDTDGIKMQFDSDVDRNTAAARLDLRHVFVFTN